LIQYKFDRLPLVIGVTGHRDLRLQDIPALEDAVTSVFARIKREHLVNADTPIILLSSLAEGADQLVARIALRHGASLIAPLPMALNEYRHDFEPGIQPGVMARFDALVEAAVAVPVVPCMPDATRDEHYRAAGIFIARHSHALIALWDGDERNTPVGGTAEIVDFFRHGVPLDFVNSAQASLDASDKGPVIHIVTPRAKSDITPPAVRVEAWGHDAQMEESEQIAWEVFEAVLALTNRFNREIADFDQAEGGGASKRKSLQCLFTSPTTNTCVESAHNMALAAAPRWCNFFALADTLAQKRQQRFKRDWLWLFSLGFAALVSFELFTHIFHGAVWLMAAYCVIFGVTLGILVYVLRREHQERYLDYRALAEALRVSIFWKLMEIDRSAADAYPIKQQNELAWVKICMRSVELLDLIAPSVTPCSDRKDVRIEWLRDIWLDGQRRYFERQGKRHERIAKACKWSSAVLLGASPLLAAGWLTFDYFSGGWQAWSWETWQHRHIWIFVIGLLPGLAAVISGCAEQLAFDAQARQYDRMRMLFAHGLDLIFDKSTKAAKPGANAKLMRALFVELGMEAMRENAGWVAIYRQHPIRLPQG
jgi:hypothetical protein